MYLAGLFGVKHTSSMDPIHMIYDDLAILFKRKNVVCVFDGDYHRHLQGSLHWTQFFFFMGKV